MKNLYITLVYIALIFSATWSQAQQKVWTNANGTDTWTDPDNWAPLGIPNSTNDVLIPEDSIVNIEDIGNGNPFMNTLTVEEGSVITKFSPNNMTMNSGVFAPGTELNILEGVIVVTGSLTINGELNSIGPLSKGLRGGSGSVDITGTMSIQSPSEPFTLREITLHILPSGTLTVEEGSIEIAAFTATLLNEGLIQKTAGTGTFTIATVFENDGGTININSGSMALSGPSTLTNGEYNVNSNGFLELNTSIHFINETLTGQLDGPFIFNSQFRVTNNTENFLDFSGPAGVEWRSSTLSAQGSPGTVLVNKGLLNITDTGTSQLQLSGGIVLRNESDIVFTETADLNIGQGSVFNNDALGTITIKDQVDISGSTFTNTGLIQKSVGTESATIGSLINNSPGTLNIEIGEVTIPSNYQGDGIISGDGVITTLASLDIAGTIAPGSNGLGELGYNNSSEFDSTSDCIYQFEIQGPTPDIEHDVFAINSNARLNGTVEVILGFEPEINDEFTIITANAITECNLPSQVTSIFNGNEYTYDVICNTDNVILKVSNVVLGLDDNALINASLYPNPTTGNFTLNLGKTYEDLNINITNILGQVITYERFVNTNTIDLTIDGSPGIYFVNIITSQADLKTLKVIKE